LFALIVLSVCCHAMEDEIGTTSFFAKPIYKIEEKVGALESRLTELEDIQRHVLNKLDQAVADEKKAIRAADKQKIVQVERWLRNKVTMVEKDKKQILKAMKKLLAILPVGERMNVLRRLKIEYRFNSVKEMIQDAHKASGFTEEQIEEFHNHQMNRAKIEKKRAEAKRKLAQAELEKKKAQEKAKEAIKLAKAKEVEQKAVQEVTKAMDKAKTEEKKSDVALKQLIEKAKEQTKKSDEKIEKLQGTVNKLNADQAKAKVVNQTEKVKLEKAKTELTAAKEKKESQIEKAKKSIANEYERKVLAQQQLIETISEQISKTSGKNKSDLEQKLLNAKIELEKVYNEKTAQLQKVAATVKA